MYRSRTDISGRSALVTGGARGIGREIVRALNEFGANVLIVDLLEDEGRSVVAELDRPDARVEFFRGDVRDKAQVTAAFDAAEAAFGSLQIVVTSAGVVEHLPSNDVVEDGWRYVMDTNVDGTFWAAQEAGRRLARGGSVITIGSMSGLIVNHPQPQASYNASKAAVHALTSSLAVEHAPAGIRFNSVAPGYIATDLTVHVRPDWIEKWKQLTPTGEMGTTQDVASLVAFLASDAASFMTGSVLTIDGGYTSW
ncbi:SDR family NAD(P)-dependent oxidoreductase [Ornithinimicrobium pratense]|uniref:SDR family oxidoreductase n=1 Tax=Ornithinimicrobium pratense TaxID=2593973 RepID=A0A5J6V979_9MICO|nr:SDR family oxidoreductase [Ornithinimicrobium pratense]QFG69746.1 SDR family oxidoreductase [Ornithinimicrobium pratense]